MKLLLYHETLIVLSKSYCTIKITIKKMIGIVYSPTLSLTTNNLGYLSKHVSTMFH